MASQEKVAKNPTASVEKSTASEYISTLDELIAEGKELFDDLDIQLNSV